MRILIFAILYLLVHSGKAENPIVIEVKSILSTQNNPNIEIKFAIKNNTNKAFLIRRPLDIDGYLGQNGVEIKMFIGNKSIPFPNPAFGITETIYKYTLEPKEIYYGKISISKFYLAHVLLDNNALDHGEIGFQLFSCTLNNDPGSEKRSLNFYSNIFYINESFAKYKDSVKEYLKEDSTNLLILYLPMIDSKKDIDYLEFLPNYQVKNSASNNEISNWMAYALIKKNYFIEQKISNVECLDKINTLLSRVNDIELKNRLLLFKDSITD